MTAPPPILRAKQARTVYLVTYSSADLNKVPTRACFAEIIVKEFNKNGLYDRVEYWASAKEKHKTEGYHYHLAIKLKGVYRWLSVKQSISRREGIVLNFLDVTTGYYNAYGYATKKDKLYILSDKQPSR